MRWRRKRGGRRRGATGEHRLQCRRLPAPDIDGADGTYSDPTAVVDAWGTVRGVEGLRIVDASILPDIPSVATNVTTIMVAERIAAKLSA